MRKIISIILCVMLVASMAVAASAATGSLSISSTDVKPGDTITVTVNLAFDEPVQSGGFVFSETVWANFEYVSSNISVPGSSLAMWSGKGFAFAYGQPTTYSGNVTVTLKAKAEVTTSVAMSGTVSYKTDLTGASKTATASGSAVVITVPHVCNLTQVDMVPATCVDTGMKAHWYCSDCGKYFTGTAPNFYETTKDALIIAANGHSYGEWSQTTAPGCTSTGVDTRVCSACGNEETRPVDATGHKFGDWTQTVAPTCTDKGEEARTCACGETETREIDTIDHTFGAWEKADDNNHKRVCTMCKEETETAAHAWELTNTVPANCKDPGKETYTCSVCEATKEKEIPSTGEHGYDTWVDNKDGTHTGTCTGCGVETKTEDHIWDNGEVTTNPNCYQPGVKTYTCTAKGCGASDTEPVPATGEHTYGAWEKVDDETHKRTCTTNGCTASETAAHNWNEGVEDPKATCSKPGVLTQACKDCGATKTTETEPTGDHDYTDKYEQSEDGKTHTGFCACGAEDEPAEHKYTEEGEVTVKPTATTEGEQIMYCVCGAETKVVLPKVDLDDVPKTGDITNQVVLTAVGMFSLIAAAAYVFKRKLAK